jgi:membrane-bound serine protease (ClpP class)
MGHKVVNDAVAYLRSLAELRGRNAEWAERAVREAASLPAQEALRLGVIDLVATDVDDLLAHLDGRRLQVLGQERQLRTAQAQVEAVPPDWHSQLLAVISNPNVAYMLLLIGLYGLIYEFANPGTALPGTLGGISLLLALYGLHVLPVNYAGMALVLVGLALMMAEAFVPSFGALGIGGLAAFIFGSVILIDSTAPGFAIAVPLILGFAGLSALVLFGTLTLALQARQRPVVSGREELLGAWGEVLEGFTEQGRIRIHGELWNARTAVSLHTGQRVRVARVQGLLLWVTPEAPPGE